MVATVEAPAKLVGQPIKRCEDPRLITCAAAFIDDITLLGLSHAAVLRSPYGHARINAIDVSAAEVMPGVIGVFTGKDMADLNPLPCAWQAGGVSNNVNTPRVLAIDEVHFSGDAVAVVVAESLAQAVDALDAIQVDYQTLPTVVDARKAMAPGALQLHENAPKNVVLTWTCGKDAAAVDAAIAASIDLGNVINPLIVDGQLHGGIAQGLAEALYEGAHYDDDGQLMTGTMNAYALPKASMVPTYELDRTITPTPVNPMGAKGAGEAGTIASTPTVANAVIDAVSHLGITHLDMPLTPERLWRAMQA